MITRLDYFAGLAMQSLLQRSDLKFVFRNNEDIPKLNSYIIKNKNTSAQELIKRISFEIANEMVKGE